MKPESVQRPLTVTGTDEVLHNASLALEATVALAPLIPVPVLSSVFSSVQVIVDAAKVIVFESVNLIRLD